MSISFDGKVAFITGAASGIARTAAIMFAGCGAFVSAVDIADATETVKTILDAGGTAESFRCDVTSESQVKNAIDSTVAAFGRIDIAFNCAGIGPDGVRIPFSLLTETSVDDWQRIIDVNLTGVFFCLKHELIQMQKQGYGAIVNTSSTAGYRFPPTYHAYCPSKAGVVALTELAANENARAGIRVNCVTPGPTLGTQLSNNSRSAVKDEDDVILNRVIPMGKYGQMEDVVKAVMWLSSDYAGHTTGQTLFVDGGMHAK